VSEMTLLFELKKLIWWGEDSLLY